MSQLNHAPVASCSKSDTALKDESQLKKASLTKLIDTASRRLNFLQVFDDRTSNPSKPICGVPSKTLFLRCQQPCQNISFKSLPPLGAKDSLENILRIRRHGEFPRRNLLRSFVKANSFERRPRRRLCQNKSDAVVGSNDPDTLKNKTCPEVNVKKLRHQLAKEKKVFNRFSIGRFGQNIRNRIRGEALKGQFGNALRQGLSYEEVVSLCKDDANNSLISSNNSKVLTSSYCYDIKPAVHESKLRANEASRILTTTNESYSGTEMAHFLEKLNLNPAECEASVMPDSIEGIQQTPDDEPPIDLTFKKTNLSTWFQDTSINDPANRTNTLKEYDDKCGSQFEELNEIGCKTVRSPITEAAEDNSFIKLQSCASRGDFSSGDDTRKLSSKLMLDEAAGVCKMTYVEETQNQDYESRRRSVQWNAEVDVIYYAGDTDGGKVVRRKMEPLREEADQQARRNAFIKLALNKNLISAFNTYKFQDPWVTMYHK